MLDFEKYVVQGIRGQFLVQDFLAYYAFSDHAIYRIHYLKESEKRIILHGLLVCVLIS